MQQYFHWLARFSLRGKVRISSAAKLQTPTSLCLSTMIKRNNVGVSALLNTPNNLSWQQTPRRRSHTSIGCVHIHVLLESSSETVKCNFPHAFPSYGFVQSAWWLLGGQTKFPSKEIRAVVILQVHSKCAPSPWWEQKDSDQQSASETALGMGGGKVWYEGIRFILK